MEKQSASSPDKTIVERLRPHAQDKSRKAVRDIREEALKSGTKSSNGSASFDYEVLANHAKTQPMMQITFLLFAVLAAYVSSFSVSTTFIAAWLGVSLIVAGVNFWLSKYYLGLDRSRAAPRHWEMRFLVLASLHGIVWACLLLAHPLHEQAGSFSIFMFSATIVMTAVTFLASRYLRFGVLVAALPMTAVVVARLLMEQTALSASFAVLMMASLYFFHRLGSSMRVSHLGFLESQAERDQLIMELEASRGISDEARRRAEDANLAKSRFLATMSHELRTPLNAILGFSEVMSNEVMGPLNNVHYKEYIGDIHRSGAHLLKLINEILDLSRVEAGRYELNEEPINLAHVADECHQMVKLKANKKSISTSMQIQPNLPPIWGDGRAIRQVILNLLSNALKFTPVGGNVWIKVGWTAGGGQYISIRDSGPGIAEDEIPIVLSSFGQGSIAIKSAEQGTGLGLPIVQALVQMHDGKFEFKSKLREGTEVIAMFPHARVLEDKNNRTVAAPSIDPTDDVSKAAADAITTRR